MGGDGGIEGSATQRAMISLITKLEKQQAPRYTSLHMAGMIPVFAHDGRHKMIYNSILIAAALAGTIVTSYRFTFRYADLDAVYWITTAVYALDILFCFNQAVKRGHKVYGDRRSIARLYLRGWFAVDVLTAIPFSFLFSAAFGGEPRAGAAGAVLDVFMAAKLLKIVKIGKVSAVFSDIRASLSMNPALMRLMTFIFWFVTVVHLMACGWCLIGASEAGRPAQDQYLRALYWCLTTIATIGYGDYTPSHDSNAQIIYTMVVMVFGVGMYGYIIGNIASLIANLDVARAAYQKKLEETNDFLRTRRIPPELQTRVRDYYAYLWETRKNVSLSSPTADLPSSLSMEILLYLNRPLLEKVALFHDAGEPFMREVIQLLQPLVFIPNDYIIRQDEYGDCMYFLIEGSVEVLVNDVRVASLGQGSPFGETALLQGERRMASVHALSYCDVYRLSKADFDSLRAKHPEFDARVKKVVEERMQDTAEKTRPRTDPAGA